MHLVPSAISYAYRPRLKRKRYPCPHADRWRTIIQQNPDILAGSITERDIYLKHLLSYVAVEPEVLECFAHAAKLTVFDHRSLHPLSLAVVEVTTIMPDDTIYAAFKEYITLHLHGRLFPPGNPPKDLAAYLRAHPSQVFRKLSAEEIDRLLLALHTRGFVMLLENGRETAVFVPVTCTVVTDYELKLQVNNRIATVRQVLHDVLDGDHREPHSWVIDAELKEYRERASQLLPSGFNNLRRNQQEENLADIGYLACQCECSRAANYGFLRDQIQRSFAPSMRLWMEQLSLTKAVCKGDDKQLRQAFAALAEQARAQFDRYDKWREMLIADSSLESLVADAEANAEGDYELAAKVRTLHAQLNA